MRYRRAILLLAIGSLLTTSAQNRSIGSIRREKAATQREISETSKQITSNKQEINSTLSHLNDISNEIEEQQRGIADLSTQLDRINTEKTQLDNKIRQQEKELVTLRKTYGRAIRNMHAHSSSFDRLLFIFSAESFHQAYRRVQYLHEFSRWRQRKAQKITNVQSQLKNAHARIVTLMQQKSNNLHNSNMAQINLKYKEKQASEYVASLREKGSQLQTTLQEKQRQANALDRELDRIIANQNRLAEQREREAAKKKAAEEQKTAERTKPKQPTPPERPTRPATPAKPKQEQQVQPKRENVASQVTPPAAGGNDFAAAQGKLMFPVTGSHRIISHFGRHSHPELRYVQTENSGIDILCEQGAQARAVFAGHISAIFSQDGFNTVVMVRHGEYLTIYVNLTQIFVRTGQAVTAGQALGKIYTDSDDGNRTVLHFEVRKEREKLNPELWLGR
jgi:murein hydrolase activator